MIGFAKDYVLTFIWLLTNLIYFVNPSHPGGQFGLLLGLYVTQFGLLYFIYKNKKQSLLLLFVVGIIARLILIPTSPIFEDDFYRYQWDGRVIVNSVNPYEYPPNSPELDSIHTDYREKIGFLHLRTIYPPLAEHIFAFNALVFNESLAGLKFIFLIFDLLIAFILYRWLQMRAKDPKILVFYLLNPMVLKEIANSAHLDPIMVFFFVASAFYLDKSLFKKLPSIEWKSWTLLALSILSKLIPIIFLPYFLKLGRRRWVGLVLFSLVLLGVSLPYINTPYFMNGLQPFSKYWVFNEFLFFPLSWLSNGLLSLLELDATPTMKSAMINEIPGKFLGALVLGIVYLYRWIKIQSTDSLARDFMWITFLLLSVSPVFNTWYGLWFLPFAIITHQWALIALTGLSALSYSWYWDKSLYPYLQLLEYSLFLVLWFWMYKKSIFKKSG
ncbi:MAG: hypothetical protein CL677_02045 [Bdellovibrionaceae bacterium]|nr:hypothetical protein [Pseudobdellovibrionaceae bacterium]|tara:strand:+ start:3286 stop:4611 length:1326 start_codon:yes stop_codon:yes gene_type:complete